MVWYVRKSQCQSSWKQVPLTLLNCRNIFKLLNHFVFNQCECVHALLFKSLGSVRFFKEIKSIEQDCIKLMKRDPKLPPPPPKKKQLFWIFYLSKNLTNINPSKNSPKISSSTTVFHINNKKKCFLSSKSAYQNDFCRIMWHRIHVMTAGNSDLLPQKYNYTWIT